MEILKFTNELDADIEVGINITPIKKDPNYNAIMKLCEILIITNNNMCVKLAAIEDALTNLQYRTPPLNLLHHEDINTKEFIEELTLKGETDIIGTAQYFEELASRMNKKPIKPVPLTMTQKKSLIKIDTITEV